jgi:hypothetical protein
MECVERKAIHGWRAAIGSLERSKSLKPAYQTNRYVARLCRRIVHFVVEKVTPEESAMLKEFDRIAKGMLFLHGHVVRPDEPETNAVRTPPKRGKPVNLSKVAVVCLATPAVRLIMAQLR